MWEPRGHADMYGALITPPVSEEADFGVLFLHNEGYSTMCGHAIIALGDFGGRDGLDRDGRKEKIKVVIDSPGWSDQGLCCCPEWQGPTAPGFTMSPPLL